MIDELNNTTNARDTAEWQKKHPALSDPMPMHTHVADCNDSIVPELELAMRAEESEHVHGPNCNHDHSLKSKYSEMYEVPTVPPTDAEKYNRDMAASYVETVLQQRNRVLDKVSVDEISKQLLQNPKGSRKHRVGSILMVPRLLATQLYHMYTRPPYWGETRWAPLLHTFEVIGYFMKEEAKRRVTAAKAQFPIVRQYLDEESAKQGLDLNVESKQLMVEVDRVEQLFRRPGLKIVPQDVHGDSIRYQPWRLNRMQTASHWERLMSQYGLKKVELVNEVLNVEST